MSGAQSIYTRRAYGVQQVCRVWHCARSSVYAWRQAILSSAPRRPADHGPVGQPDGGRDVYKRKPGSACPHQHLCKVGTRVTAD